MCGAFKPTFYIALQMDGSKGTFYTLGGDVNCLFYKPAGGTTVLMGSGETKEDLFLPDQRKVGEPTDKDKKLANERLGIALMMASRWVRRSVRRPSWFDTGYLLL